AHGTYNSKGETTLYLLDSQNQVAPLPASELIKDLKRLRGVRGLPHLAFLCTCESAKPDAESGLGGLGQRLVRELGLPAVVAMTDPVSIATAEELASAFYGRLHEHGNPDQALTEACASMMNRPDILVPALYSRLGGRSLFSDDLTRPLTDPEIQYGLERCTTVLAEQAPVLLDEFTGHARILEETLGVKPEALSKERREERDKTFAEVNGLCEEALDISFPAAALGQNIPIYEAICPFPGLKAFQTDEQKFFFGRDQKSQELTARLSEKSFLAVLGASGSGKSSLVLAGMIPALKKQAEEKGKSLQIRYLTPGSEPETALTRQLEIPSQPGQTILLLVDQFEELFTLCADPAARKAFLDKLLSTRNERSELSIILTMRADFWGDCAPYPKLRKIMQAHQE
ncbi:MAG: CHAT domain-containing protein, partial [Candidatus Electrothrix sp. AR5]|nr:CHAT domain-containing protein [Candidatus Electrothrix sp. AR5]